VTEGRKKADPPGYAKGGKLTCRECGCQHFEVVNVFSWLDEGRERRKRCRNCGWIVRTREVVVDDD